MRDMKPMKCSTSKYLCTLTCTGVWMDINSVLSSTSVAALCKTTGEGRCNNISALCDHSALWPRPLVRVIDELRHVGSTRRVTSMKTNVYKTQRQASQTFL